MQSESIKNIRNENLEQQMLIQTGAKESLKHKNILIAFFLLVRLQSYLTTGLAKDRCEH